MNGKQAQLGTVGPGMNSCFPLGLNSSSALWGGNPNVPPFLEHMVVSTARQMVEGVPSSGAWLPLLGTP